MKKLGICILSLLCAGIFCLTVLAAAPGDVDGSGEVTVDDARLALRAAVGLETYSVGSGAFAAADVDGSGEIEVSDAREILRAAVGLVQLQENAVPGMPLSSKEIYRLAKTYTFEIHTTTEDYEAIGSGFALTSDGEIVTNYHVIADAQTVTVSDYDGNEYPVLEIAAFDRDVDLAVLKVDGTLTPAALDRTAYETGDTVYTLGSANGYTGTFANGVISNAHMSLPDYNKKVTYIQTSAPISGGNSGGPLIDEYGRVIGVNTLTDTEGQNLNFAIPVSYLDGLDRSAPLTPAAFAEAERNFKSVFVYYGDEAPHIRVGGTAVVVLDGVTRDPATLACKYDSSVLRAAVNGQFLYIAALKPCEDEVLTVYMNEFPEVTCEIRVTASPEGKTTFGLFDEAPDLGALYGVAPTFSSLDSIPLLSRLPGVSALSEVSYYPLLNYDFSGQNKKADEVRAAYEQALTDAGFTLTRKSILGAYTYTNEKTGVTVTYADSRRLNGTLRSVTLQIL